MCGLTAAFTMIKVPTYSTGKSLATPLQPCKAGNKKALQFKTGALAASL